MKHAEGLLDTSVFIALESGRPIDRTLMPVDVLVSVITIAELQVGIHAAADAKVRALRLQTLDAAIDLEPLSVDAAVAGRWAMLRVQLAEAGRHVNVNDLWIAAVALANDLPVVTQDSDFDALADLGGPEIIRV